MARRKKTYRICVRRDKRTGKFTNSKRNSTRSCYTACRRK